MSMKPTCGEFVGLAYANDGGLREFAEEILADNAKLRELVRDLHKALFSLDIDHCQMCPRDNINGPCKKFMVHGSDECSIEEDMRELGIEVKG